MRVPKHAGTECFAMIVDINGFVQMVKRDDMGGAAAYTHDVLIGAVAKVEKNGGEVVAFMGDAFLSLLGSADDVFQACHDIAKDVDAQCEYISEEQQNHPELWPFARGGPSIKILIEFGHISIVNIQSDFLGQQPLLIGKCINYASRLGAAGVGNRCLLGPEAAKLIKAIGFEVEGPWEVIGKDKAEKRQYFKLPLGDVWREGDPDEMKDSYWG